MNQRKGLPIGFSNLKDLLGKNRVYVDKTELLYKVITDAPKYSLLTRPRRFGKSLIISTLEQIFLGSKDLFKDLWIGQEGRYDWKKYPVIRIDLSSIDSSCAKNLAQRLEEVIIRIADSYGIDVRHCVDAGSKMEFLIRNLAETQGQEVLLIDEYDYPITAQIKNPVQVEANAQVMRAFYTNLKSLNEYIRCMFITGVSKYPQESIFSGLNNVKDISFKPEYAGLTGYTEDELRSNFASYITEVAQAQGVTEADLLIKIKSWYNGYRFSADPLTVYNPFSVINFFDDKVFNNYWFLSGTPTFLVDILKTQKYTDDDFSDAFALPSRLVALSQTKPGMDVLLYQTGYATITSFIAESNAYYLGYPNHEVRASMQENLLALMVNADLARVSGIAIVLLERLRAHDVERFMQAMSTLLANIPYDHHIKKESYYHSLFQVIANILGLDVTSEVHVSGGRIDMVITLPDAVFVFEFKCNQLIDTALQQIHDRRYYQKFLVPTKASRAS